jgi:type IV secretion system protein VirD4
MNPAAQYGHISRPLKKNYWFIIGPLLLLTWASCVVMWVMQQIGAAYGNHPALGYHFEAFGHLWYWPWEIFFWPSGVLSSPVSQQYIDTGNWIFSSPLLVLLALVLYALTGATKGRKDLHGSAKWASQREIQRMGYLSGQGVYIGGYNLARTWPKKAETLYLRDNGGQHILCFAPTGSGKGVGLILPTLLAWEESSVILDIKGENYALTAGWRKSRGHKIVRFEPANSSDTVARFNPLEEIRLDSERAIADVQQIATMVLDPEGKGFSDYWNKAAFGFFGGVLLHCLIVIKFNENRTASLYDVSVMIEDPDRDDGPTGLFEEIINTDHAMMLWSIYPNIARESGKAAHVFCAAAARGMLAKAKKEMAGVVSSATANLGLYRDPVIAQNISRCDFRIHDLMRHDTPVDLYLVVSPGDANRLRPLLRIMLTQILGRLTEKMEFADGAGKADYKHRLLLMLDEFTSLGKLPVVEHAIAYMRGYGIKGYFIVQDTKQLAGTYGSDNAIIANCHIRIAYAPNQPETAEYLSKMTGTTTVVKQNASVSYSKGQRSRSVNYTETSRPLLTPDECMRLPGATKNASGTIVAPGDMLVFTGGESPIYGQQILYFLDPVFTKRAKIPPPNDSDRIAPLIVDQEQPGSELTSIPLPTEDEYAKHLESVPSL